MVSEIKYYECKKCSSIIEPDTKKKLVFCKCGAISVDGTLFNSRILGDLNLLKTVFNKEVTYTYRLRQVSTGLYFKPSVKKSSNNFFKTGKFYTKKPSLKWVRGFYRNGCVIEKYLLTII